MLEQQILLLSRFVLMKCFWNMQWLIKSRKKVCLMAARKQLMMFQPNIVELKLWLNRWFQIKHLRQSAYLTRRLSKPQRRRQWELHRLMTHTLKTVVHFFTVVKITEFYVAWETRTTTANFRISTSAKTYLAEHVFAAIDVLSRSRQLRNSKVE